MASGKPAPPKDASALPTTRQMLDELDALMERMLAVPVNDLDEAASAAQAPMPPPRNKLLSARLTPLDVPAEPATPSASPQPLLDAPHPWPGAAPHLRGLPQAAPPEAP